MGRIALIAALVAAVLCCCTAQDRSFKLENNRFVKDGKEINLISGSIHYHRIHPAYWRDRLLRVRALGLNAIQFLVPWNYHEPYPGQFKWDGWQDLERWLTIAQELDLMVLIRPGPYICGEWEFGGFPFWLQSSEITGGGADYNLRSDDPTYLAHVDRWWDVLLPKIAPFLYSRGGPIVMVQLENEHGYCPYAPSPNYIRNLLHRAQAALGEDSTIFYTTDPPWLATVGSLPADEVYTVVDFGPNIDANYAFQAQAAANAPGHSPPFCSEYYTGWLSHWSEPMANTSSDAMADGLRKILGYANNTGSVNFYMSHGGTNFGYWAGANLAGDKLDIYQPHITSYDYDSPISEAGHVGQPGIGGPNKFNILRDIIKEFTGVEPHPEVEPPLVQQYGALELTQTAPLLEQLSRLYPGDGIVADVPLPMEEYGQMGGFIVYSTVLAGGTLQGAAVLDIGEPVHDYAQVLVNNQVVATLERNSPGNVTLPGLGDAGEVALHIVVHAMGRQNFGCVWDYKGLTSPAIKINGNLITGWRVYPLQLEDLSSVQYGQPSQKVLLPREASARPIATSRRSLSGSDPASNGPQPHTQGPVFYRGTFDLDGAPRGAEGHLGDTFLNVKGWGKGLAFVNGFNLGWYWPTAGPQMTLYLPGPLLHERHNEIILLETEQAPQDLTVRLDDVPDLYGPGGPQKAALGVTKESFDRAQSRMEPAQ